MENEKNKICAVICEFNPFHAGHAYLVKKIKEKLPDCRLVAIMSGDFVQRAEPAIFDKYFRTEQALKNGFSAVIQMPTIFSTASAELFALSGIDIALNTNASYLAFGCETPSALLSEIAQLQIDPTEKFKNTLRTLLDSGISYATALSEATRASMDKNGIKDILSKPNNILAIEYLKAIKKTNNRLEPIMIQRQGAEYNDTTLSETQFPSASALRDALKKQKNVDSFLQTPTPKICDYDLYDKIAVATLKLAPINKIASLPDCSEGIEFKLKKSALKYNNLNQIIMETKTKRYTYARIKRIVLQLILGIEAKDYKSHTFPSKILGFIKNDKILQNCKKPVFIKNSEYKDETPLSLEVDNRASLLASFLFDKNENPLSLKPVIL